MATLTPLTVGNATGTYSPAWTSAPNGALGDNSDATFGTVESNGTGTYDQGWELANVDADFASILTLSVVLRYRWTATPNGLTTWDTLGCRIMSGATVLAAADSGGSFKTIASSITTTTITNSASSAFAYVNTGATKTQWDAAVVEIRISQTKSKGGDTTPRAIYEADFTGTYTAAAGVTASPTAASMALSGATPAVSAGGSQSRQPTAASLTLSGAVPSVATGGPLYVSPSGSDSTGDGSIGNPWATPQPFINLSPGPGSTLYLRGGTYSPTTSYAGHAANSFGVLVGASGSPITIRNYPGETPVIDGGTTNWLTLSEDDDNNTVGTAYVVIDGIRFTNWDSGSSGIIFVGGWGAGVYTRCHDVTIRNCYFELAVGTTQNGHCVYFSYGCQYLTVEDCEFHGPGNSTDGGAGVEQYHATGDGAADQIIVQRCAFDDFLGASGSRGVQLWDDNSNTTASVLHCTFGSNNYIDIDATHHGPLLVQDNVFADTSLTLYDPNDSASTTADHNYTGETLGTGYTLTSGSSAIGGAHDGSDAGWVAYVAAIVALPTAVSLTLSGATTTVAAGGSQSRQPTAASLTLTGSTPTVATTANVTSQPTTGAMTLAGATPAVTAGGSQSRQPTAATLTLAGATPAVSVTANVTSLPTAAGLTITGATPTVAAIANVTTQPSAASLSLSGATPAVSAGGSQSRQPTSASLELTGATPAVSAGGAQSSQPSPASLTLTGATPAVSADGGVISLPTAAGLTLAGLTPNVSAGGAQSRQPSSAGLTLTGATPVVTAALGVRPLPTAASLALAGATPAVSVPIWAQPTFAELVLSGAVLDVTTGTAVIHVGGKSPRSQATFHKPRASGVRVVPKGLGIIPSDSPRST